MQLTDDKGTKTERQETLIVRALVKLENRIDALRGGEIVEDHLVRTDTHDGAILLE
jgi:hypothetical protein